MSVSMTIRSEGIDQVLSRLNRIAGFTAREAAQGVSAILESQTRRRIETEKRSPAGVPWKPNRAGTPILMRTGRNLHDSIAGRAEGADAIVEAHWQFAHVHQGGMTIRPKTKSRLVFRIGGNGQPIFARQVTIPKREFIGLSPDNEKEIVAELNATLAELAGGRR